jgi:hypothetical protein
MEICPFLTSAETLNFPLGRDSNSHFPALKVTKGASALPPRPLAAVVGNNDCMAMGDAVK